MKTSDKIATCRICICVCLCLPSNHQTVGAAGGPPILVSFRLFASYTLLKTVVSTGGFVDPCERHVWLAGMATAILATFRGERIGGVGKRPAQCLGKLVVASGGGCFSFFVVMATTILATFRGERVRGVGLGVGCDGRAPRSGGIGKLAASRCGCFSCLGEQVAGKPAPRSGGVGKLAAS